MTTPILIDLDNLTREMVEEALPHMGECKYSAPCIIGTLLPAEARVRFDGSLQGAVNALTHYGEVAFARPEQAEEALKLQCIFDAEDRDAFLSHPRIAALMREAVAA